MDNLLINLLTEKISIFKAEKEQNEMLIKLNGLKEFILLKEKGIEEKTKGAIKKTKNKTQRNQILAAQKRVIRDATKLYNKRNDIFNTFMNKNILPGDVEKDVYYKSEE